MGWLDKILNKGTQEPQLSEEAQRWNRFIDEICMKERSALSSCQKAAVHSFWYDSEMNSGGHSGYFDCYPGVKADDLIWALNEVGAKAYIENFKEATSTGESDDFMKTDEAFYSIKPPLADILMKYEEEHKEEILK